MNKKIVKNLMIILLICSLSFAFLYSNYTFALDVSAGSYDIDAAGEGQESSASNAAKSIGASLITVMKTVAVGVAIIMLVVLGMKYMSAAPDEKASIKKSATIYVVGAIIMFAIAGILQIIQGFADQIKAE